MGAMASHGRQAHGDLYGVLGVEPSATAEAIISAFRARVRELRPDTRVDAVTAERFGQLWTAYETLRDPALRASYDRGRATAASGPVPPVRPVRPVRRVATGRVVPPEPPLRAGPVRWERGS
jgi:curved DNA-binding protein CbpA